MYRPVFTSDITLAGMEHIAPLIQTVLWVGLIAGIVWRFHSPIYGLLVALQKRIESGSNVKAGPFEISDQLKPQDPIAQKAKVAEEVQEVLQAQSEAQPAGVVPAAVPAPATSKQVQARYFQAEDLALRALQSEYGIPVSRQVTAGRDSGFDGLFMLNGRPTIVEVKYVAAGSKVGRVRPSIEKVTDAVRNYGWKNAQIILALVFEGSDDVQRAREFFSSVFAENPVPVVVRVFTFDQLREQFGVECGHAG